MHCSGCKMFARALFTVFCLTAIFVPVSTVSQISFDDCRNNSTTVCFEYPEKCMTKSNSSCVVAAKLSKKNETSNFVYLELTAQQLTDEPLQYIAVGFSSDMQMAETSVTECVFNSSTQQANVYLSYNPGPAGSHNANQRIHNDTVTAELLKMDEFGALEGNMICKFHRMIELPMNSSEVFSLDSYYHLIFVTYYAAEDNIEKHVTDRASPLFPQVTAKAYKFSDMGQKDKGLNAKELRQFKMKQAHASLMLFTMMLLFLPAIIIARYFRDSFPNQTLFDLKIWFQCHRSLNLLGVLCVIVAVILVVASENWMWSGPRKGQSLNSAQIHSCVGLATVILVFCQPVGALFRCHPDHEFRMIFNWIHRMNGLLLLVLAAVAIAFATQMPMGLEYDERGAAPITLMTTFLFVLIVVIVLMEFDARKKLSQSSTDSVSEMPLLDEQKKIGTFRGLVLAVFAAISMGFYIAFVCFINSAEPTVI